MEEDPHTPIHSQNSQLCLDSQRRPKKRPKTDVWWKYFTENEREKTASCKLCQYVTTQGGNANMQMPRHLDGSHPEVFKSLVADPSRDKVFTQLEKKEIAMRTAVWMIIKNRPFIAVKDSYFEAMMLPINQNWSPPDQKTIGKCIKELHRLVMGRMKGVLSQQDLKFFCQTADGSPFFIIAKNSTNSIKNK